VTFARVPGKNAIRWSRKNFANEKHAHSRVLTPPLFPGFSRGNAARIAAKSAAAHPRHFGSTGPSRFADSLQGNRTWCRQQKTPARGRWGKSQPAR
jgi:hypothetical protein